MLKHVDQRQLQQLINQGRCQDRFKHWQRLKKLASATHSNKLDQLTALRDDIITSQQWVESRRESAPTIEFDQALPINQKRDEIAKLIQEHQVTIVAGETGSGKTTQIPKICLSLGLGSKGLIGHTQPRRIAARTVASRIAEELHSTLGDIIAYQVRFNDQSSENSRVKLMTDGILLAEMQRDRFLSQYEVIIIDEAHERSLNIDFLLGLLKRLLKKRPDLKVIITSATIDVAKFSEHFNTAPIIEVSGRTYPVDVIYQENEDQQDLSQTITNTVKQIIDSERQGEFLASGDILVFCSGEREIRDCAKALLDSKLHIDILPLYARLSMQEQTRVFKPAKQRKVVLATNVAETSITVPGIAYVIDPGMARISRYNFRSKVQGLPIERISQASANQRMGRCGRVANGVCIRLYSEEDFLSRAEFTEAELLRSNLASVILQMLQMGIHDIKSFPFIDQPDNRLLNDGFKLLEELQAVQSKQNQRHLSKIGHTLAKLPIDPKYARILLEANTRHCLHELLIIVAALSIQDPREWPADKRQAAQQKHAEYRHSTSDFLDFLNLWETINAKRKQLSNKQFKEFCSTHFLSIVRIFEWRDMVGQLTKTTKQLGWKSNATEHVGFLKIDVNEKPATKVQKQQLESRYNAIHQALLSGLLSNLISKDQNNEYFGARGRKLALFPNSVLASKKAPSKAKWIIANELMETSRLFAVTCAKIDPEWITDAAKHLLRYSYSNPEYHAKDGVVKVQRNSSLYGLSLQDKTTVVYSDIEPVVCRELFIQRALVEGAYAQHSNYRSVQKKTNFFTHNETLIAEIEQAEAKIRRRNLLISDAELFKLYVELIPDNVTNHAGFEHWRKTVEMTNPEVLYFSYEQLTINSLSKQQIQTIETTQFETNQAKPKSPTALFPNYLEVQGKKLALSYHFNPNDEHDGVTLHIPIELLAPLPEHIGSWLVPGLLREKCIALIKTLPKQYRKLFAPAAQAVDRVLEKLEPENTPLHIALGKQLNRATGHSIANDAWKIDALDDYYLLNYRVVTQVINAREEPNTARQNLIQSRDLNKLKQQYAEQVTASLKIENAPERKAFEQSSVTSWDFGSIAKHVDYQHQGMTVRAYPALFQNDDDKSLILKLHESQSIAEFFNSYNLVKLALIDENTSPTLKQNLHYLRKEVFKPQSKQDPIALQMLALAPNKSTFENLKQSLIERSLWQCCIQNSDIISAETFQHSISSGKAQWVETAIEYDKTIRLIAKQLTIIQRLIKDAKVRDEQTDQNLEDIKTLVFSLFEENFLLFTDTLQLKQIPRYLQVAEIRLQKLHMTTPVAFQSWQNKIVEYTYAAQKQAEKIEPSLKQLKLSLAYVLRQNPNLYQAHIMLHEWHSSLFAQQLRTQFPISETRIEKFWNSHLKAN